jgi:hypothetical protein
MTYPWKLRRRSPSRRSLCLDWIFLSRVAVLLFVLPVVASAEEPAAKVEVVVNYGDGVEKRFTAVSWKEEMTVLDAMKHAQNHPRGIKIEYRGSGATAFLTQIDDLKNEGSGRNWIYRVNGELATRSFAIQELKRGDAVLWSFEKSR